MLLQAGLDLGIALGFQGRQSRQSRGAKQVGAGNGSQWLRLGKMSYTQAPTHSHSARERKKDKACCMRAAARVDRESSHLKPLVTPSSSVYHPKCDTRTAATARCYSTRADLHVSQCILQHAKAGMSQNSCGYTD